MKRIRFLCCLILLFFGFNAAATHVQGGAISYSYKETTRDGIVLTVELRMQADCSVNAAGSFTINVADTYLNYLSSVACSFVESVPFNLCQTLSNCESRMDLYRGEYLFPNNMLAGMYTLYLGDGPLRNDENDVMNRVSNRFVLISGFHSDFIEGNSSPAVNNPFLFVNCLGQSKIHPFDISDANGNRYEISQSTPFNDGAGFAGNPITYFSPYSASAPFGSNGNYTLNTLSGTVQFQGTMGSLSPFGDYFETNTAIRIEEYSGSTLIGFQNVEFSMDVADCSDLTPLIEFSSAGEPFGNEITMPACTGPTCVNVSSVSQNFKHVTLTLHSTNVPGTNLYQATSSSTGNFCWDPGMTAAGTYYAIFKSEEEFCLETYRVLTIIVPEVTPPTVTGVVTQNCDLVCDEAIDLTVNGSGTYSYLWSNGANSQDLEDLCTGTYSVQVNFGSDGDCIVEREFEVLSTPNNAPNLESYEVGQIGNVPRQNNKWFINSCSETNCIEIRSYDPDNDLVSIVVDAATLPLGATFQLLSSPGDPAVGLLCFDLASSDVAQIIEFTANDGHCNEISYSLQFSFDVINPTISAAITDDGCASELFDGAIDLSVTGAGTYTYLWSNGATTQDIANLQAGDYTVTIKSGSCTYTRTYHVDGPDFTITKRFDQVTNDTYAGLQSDYKITIRNNTNEIKSIVVVEQFDPNFHLLSANPFTNVITFNPNEEKSFTVSGYYILSTYPGTVTNCVSINWISDGPWLSSTLPNNVSETPLNASCGEPYESCVDVVVRVGCPIAFYVQDLTGCSVGSTFDLCAGLHAERSPVSAMIFDIVHPIEVKPTGPFTLGPDIAALTTVTSSTFSSIIDPLNPTSLVITHIEVNFSSAISMGATLPTMHLGCMPFEIVSPFNPNGSNHRLIWEQDNLTILVGTSPEPTLSQPADLFLPDPNMECFNYTSSIDADFDLTVVDECSGTIRVTQNETDPDVIHRWYWGDFATTPILGGNEFEEYTYIGPGEYTIVHTAFKFGGAAAQESKTVTIYSYDFTTNWTYPSNLPVSCGSSLTLHSGYAPYSPLQAATTIQWYKNGVAIAGANGVDYEVVDIRQSASYSVEISNACNTYHSPIVNISISLPALIVNLTASSNPSYYGEQVTVSASVINPGDGVNYEWYVNGVLLAGQIGSVLVSNSFDNGDVVQCKVTRTNSCLGTTTEASANVTLQVLGCGTRNHFASQITRNSVRLNWEGNTSGYTVYYRRKPVNPSSPINYSSITVTTPFVLLSGLVQNTTYEWYVVPFCDGQGQVVLISPVMEFTTLLASGNSSCGTPTGLLALNVSQTSADLTWSSATQATAFRLNISKRVYPTLSNPHLQTVLMVQLDPALILNASMGAYVYHVMNLDPNTQYVWTVTSLCNGQPVGSASGEFTTLWSEITNPGGNGNKPIVIGGNKSLLQDVKDQLSSDLELFPNPAEHKVSIRFEAKVEADAIVQIYDAMGKLVLEEQFIQREGANELNLPIQALSPGIHILRILGGDEPKQIRFVKQ